MAGSKRIYDGMETDTSVTTHGVVVEVYPMKTSRNNPDLRYFSGKAIDGKKDARLI